MEIIMQTSYSAEKSVRIMKLFRELEKCLARAYGRAGGAGVRLVSPTLSLISSELRGQRLAGNAWRETLSRAPLR